MTTVCYRFMDFFRHLCFHQFLISKIFTCTFSDRRTGESVEEGGRVEETTTRVGGIRAQIERPLSPAETAPGAGGADNVPAEIRAPYRHVCRRGGAGHLHPTVDDQRLNGRHFDESVNR